MASDGVEGLRLIGETLVELKWKLEAQKALIIRLIAKHYAEDAELYLSLLEDVRGQNEIAGAHIEEILQSLKIDPSSTQ